MRLFIAVNFSDEIKEVLQNAIANLKAGNVSGNFSRPENLHLTLAFIGETNRVSDIRKIMDGVSMPPFEISTEGFGKFGDLFWVGIKNSYELIGLAEGLKDDLRRYGFDIERRKFKPHITIVRKFVSDTAVKLNVPEVAMTVGRISLMKSERINGRLKYAEIYGKDL